MKMNPFTGANLSDVDAYLSERFYHYLETFSAFLLRKWGEWREKSRERLTVMLIPHSEKKIFKLELTNLSISLWVLVLACIVIFASVTIIHHSSTVKEVDILIGSEKDSKRLINEFRKETRRLVTLFDQFKPELARLYALTHGSAGKRRDLFGGIGGPAGEVRHEEKDDMDTEMVPDEIYSMERIKEELKIAVKTMDGIRDTLLSRREIIKNTPSVWPVEGYIGSLFGKRYSPNTGRMGMNEGVDIVSFPGAMVRATAPGKVIFSGWDEKLGLTVKIRHKYGYITTYGYNQRITVKKGQTVNKNEVIGYVGRTGIVKDYTCHYRVRIGTVYVDPIPYLNHVSMY